MSISHLIGPQIFPISLSKLGHNISHYKNPETHILSNFIIIILLSLIYVDTIKNSNYLFGTI